MKQFLSCRRVLSVLVTVAVVAAAARGATPAEISASLDKAKAYLYGKQSADGTWEKGPTADKAADDQSALGGQFSGHTALIVYAMLSAGEKASEPKLAKAIEFLKKTDTLGTYALGLRCQVWLMLPQTPDVKARMQKDSQILVRTARSQGNAQGMYDYVFDTKGNAYSHSRSQYAVLGVWAAERAGTKVPEAYWPAIEKAWVRNQDPSGGWTYTHPADNRNKLPVTPGMTAVGVATLFITQDYVNANALCKGNVDSPAITRGMKWMADNMAKVATDEKYDRDFPYPTLYAVERIGVAAGVKYIGGVDWYQKGAAWLLKKQSKAGDWGAGGFANAPYQNTAFAMLFLGRGRAPLVMNKLDFSTDPAKPAAWNQRPRDVANVVRWISSNTERDLGWQSVDLKAPLKDLAEAPILYMAGSDDLTLTDEHKAKLKAFIESGGLILAHADCGKPTFGASFRKIAGELYPNYEFRELPEASPVYGVFSRAKWKTKPSVLAASNGVREIMMLIPQADPAKAWQTRQLAGKEEMYQLAANIFLYATNKEKLQYRGESYVVTPDPAIKPAKTIDVARVQFDGNWDPEPGGWRRLAAMFHNNQKATLNVTPVKVGSADLGKARFAHLTGTGKFALKPEAVEALKKFVDGGGTLLIDAAGGDGDFATAAEALAVQVAPAGKLATILPESPLLKDVKDVRYRTYARMKGGVGATSAARLQGVQVNGRTAVIVSRDDLSAGLLGPEMDGIIGYEPETAVSLMTSAILASQAK